MDVSPFRESILKIIRVMKLVSFFLLVGFLQVSANIYSQTANIKLSIQGRALSEVIKEIQKQTELSFFYSPEDIRDVVVENVKLEKASLEETLDLCLKGTKLSYQVIHGTVIIKKNEKPETENRTRPEAASQSNIVKGKVTDSDGNPVPGVTITLVGTTRGAITDTDGSYTIEASSADKLVFSFIGMENQIVDVGNNNVINVQMKEKLQELDDVTVVAYGKQKKESVIGSIATVRPSELKVPSSNLTTALAGKVAGIISYQRSGEPGADNADFFVRGVTTFGYKTDPLILIDGIELSSNDLARLQPDDIASFSIMKDATATALYGARGANGVILVTTKEGKEGKAKLSFRVENSFSAPTRDVDLADPVTYMKLSNEAILTRYPLGMTLYSDDKIESTAAKVNPLVYPANDWRKMLFKDYASNQRYNLNVSGGGQIARYYVAGSYSKDNGILEVDERNNFNSNINLQKYTLRTNVNINVTPTTEMVVRLSGSFDDYTGPLDGGSGMYDKVMHSNPVLFPAYYPVDEDHKYVNHIMFGNYDEGQYTNPYADMVKGYRDYSRSQMIALFELHQDLKWIAKGLNFRAMANTIRNSYFTVTRSYNPYYYALSTFDKVENKYSIDLLNEDSGTEWLNYNEGNKTISSEFYLESALNYARTFDKHELSGLLIYTMKHSLQANAGSLQLSLPSRNLGLSGRMTYSYDGRYYTEFNFGYNGSERFEKSHRFGFFPSAGVAWNISNEDFWEPYRNTVSNLKIRGTYGLVGNDAIGSSTDRFFYLSEVNMNDGNKGALFGRDWGYSRNGVTVNRYANDKITWEVAKKLNFALEMGLFQQKVNIQAEVFKERRSNILMTRADIPVTMGLAASVKANVGEASSSGTDISIDYNQSWSNEMWLSARANFTYATSKYEVYEEPEYAEPWRFHKGNSLSQNFGYIAERLFIDDADVENSPTQSFGKYSAGDIKYQDVNRDGIINEADMVPIGNPMSPEMIYGFGFSFGYKRVDFSAFFQGLANESFWINPRSTSPFQNQTQILKAYADSHWAEDNRDVYSVWPRLSNEVIENNAQPSTWFMRDGSFLRLKQVELGYTIPKRIQNKIHASTFRFYVSATNLLTFSKFKMWDVEMGGEGLGYPIQRTLNIGLNISFN